MSVATSPSPSTGKAGPLAGITVIDLSRILAGPYATMLMADLGARVIKVETPGGGDDARAYGPFVNGKSAYFQSVNRGKESIALNLKDDGDRAVFEKLLEGADVILENFRPGAMEKLGYGWEQLHPRYPKLIYASASGFGHSGPEMYRPAYDMVVQGMGGIMSITGHEGGEPTRIGMSIGDIGSGLYAMIGVQAALYHRAMTGEAQKVDIGMFDCQLALLENAIMRYFVSGKAPGPLGARHPNITPFEAFKTADGHVIISAGNDALWRKMATGLGKPDLGTDERFASNDLRTRNYDALKAEIDPILASQPTAHWIEAMDAQGVPCGPINDVGQSATHPQAAARNMIVDVDDPVTGPMKIVGNPIKLTAHADPSTRPPAPNLDEHREKILKEISA
jgi:CoA:oxalate CoA-transferase